MSDSSPRVSFITVNFQMRDYIRNLLKGIEDAKLGFSYEYLLVDNYPPGKQDGILEIAREQFPWVKTMDTGGNLGFGRGNNLAMKEAKGDYILLANPDLTVFPGELEKWIEWMDQHPDVGISGPRTLNPDGTDQESCYRFYTIMMPLYRRTVLGKLPWAKREVDRFAMKGMDRTKEQDVDWVQGSAMCIRRSLLEKIGGFDERYFMYLEDSDLCRQAWENGMRVTYTPVAKVVHYHQRQSRLKKPWDIFTNKTIRYHVRSAYKYFQKYQGKPNPRELREKA